MCILKNKLKVKSKGQKNTTVSFINNDREDFYVGTNTGKIISKNYSFQNHESEFDYLESTEISEKINGILTFDGGSYYNNIVSCNEKSIKVWKIRPKMSTKNILERMFKKIDTESVSVNNTNNIRNDDDEIVEDDNYQQSSNTSENIAKSKIDHDIKCEVVKNVHSYSINNISTSPNTHLLLSSDYLNIYLWQLHTMDHCFSLIDNKPEKYEELDFVITKSHFKDNYTYGYSTSHGAVYINDLRMSPKSTNILIFSAVKKSFYDDLRCAISDFTFKEHLLVTRDMNSVSIFDIRGRDESVDTVKVAKENNDKDDTNKLIEDNNKVIDDKVVIAPAQLKNYKIKTGVVQLFEMKDSVCSNILESDYQSENFTVKVIGNKIVTGGRTSEVYLIDLNENTKDVIKLGGNIGSVECVSKWNDGFVCGVGDTCYFYEF